MLMEICQDVYDLTGWTLVCLAGGPEPRNEGKVLVKT